MEASNYRIAVLYYGSSTYDNNNHPETTLTLGNSPTEGWIANHVFAKELSLPLSLGRKSNFIRVYNSPCLRMALREGAPDTPVLYANSRFSVPSLAITNLAHVEDCRTEEIGFIDIPKNESRSRLNVVAERITQWAKINKFDAVIWSDRMEDPDIVGHEKEVCIKNLELMQHTKNYLRNYYAPLTVVQQEILVLPEEVYVEPKPVKEPKPGKNGCHII